MQNFKNKIPSVVSNEDGTIDLNQYPLQRSLDQNVLILEQIFKSNDNVIKRLFQNQENPLVKIGIFFIDGMVNNEIINENIIKPVMMHPSLQSTFHTLEVIQNQILFCNDVKLSVDFNEIVESVLYGDTAMFVDGCKGALIINSKGFQIRSISEPDSEKALRGSHEGFTETILINASLIRRRLKTSDLKFQYRTIGTRSNTKVCLCYLESVADKKILKELNKRLNSFEIDGLLDSNYIAENIKDSKLSLFKTIGVTERPDAVAGKLLEGRIALLVDGTPEVLTVPYLFIENFQTSDDYYINFYFSSIGRLLRILSFWLTISIPAIFLALVNYHKEMIPTPLAVSIAESHVNVPFPSTIEMVLMLIIFEIIREGGIRMPSYIGQALSLVGALVIGEAAVSANIFSAPIVIIVALTAMTGLINTKIKSASIVIRFFLIFLSSIIGLYGYIFGVILIITHIISLRSFGVPFNSQMNSIHLQDQKDMFIRAPMWFMKKRPNYISKNKIRIKENGGQS